MASGTLGSADLTAATNTTLYSVTAGQVSTFTVAFCNRNSSPVKVRVSIGSAAPANKDFLVYDRTIPANGEFERTGLTASAGDVVVVRSDKAGVSARAFGFEEAQL